MVQTDDAVGELLRALSEAKAWPERFQGEINRGADMRDAIRRADRDIERLERQAREAMKRLGCVSPQTRMVYHGMADMLINWRAFKDNLG